MEIKIIETNKDEVSEFYNLGAFSDEGNLLSKGVFRYRSTVFGQDYAKTMTAGAIATPVHLRRGGNVRKMFEYMHKKAYEDGVCTAILHPFSFAYYNMFGYEKVADHLIVRLPIRYIDFVPRRCSLVPYSEEMLPGVAEAYSKFAKGRCLMFERKTPEQFARYKDAQIYVYKKDGAVLGYITYKTEKTLMINHYEKGLMTVLEMVYATSEALNELLSFIRMYEGELEDVEFANLAMSPEVDAVLRNYTHTSYRLLPDIAAKVINAEEMLKLNVYPNYDGDLTIKVPEGDVGVRGVYKIEWGKDGSQVRRLNDNADADVSVSAQALARLLYGYDVVNAFTLPYLRGIELQRNSDGFIAAFQKKCSGVYEHF